MYSGIPFPNIGPIAVQIGGFALRWYSLAYLAGILFAWTMAKRMVEKYRSPFTKDMVDDAVFYGTFGMILGARIGYVLFYNFHYYFEHPLQILALWQGGMSFHGALLGIIVGLYAFSRRMKIGFFTITDVFAAVGTIGVFFGRLANFANAELYGRVTTSVPWAMVFPNAGPMPRHPSQLYEALLEGLVIFAVLYPLWTKSVWVRIRIGFTSGLFLVLYALSRGIIENFREPDAHIGFLFGSVTMGQLLTLPMLIGGVVIMIWSMRNK